MAYNQIPFKTSRAVAAYIKAGSVSGLDPEEVFPHKSSGYRAFPNVTVLVSGFTEDTTNLGSYTVNILVSIRTACSVAVGGSASDPVYASEAIVGAIADLFKKAEANNDDRFALCTAITAAGRALSSNTADADMEYFIVDYIAPMAGGNSTVEVDDRGKCWADEFPFEMRVRAIKASEE